MAITIRAGAAAQLAVLPVGALLQVAVGTVLGKLASKFAVQPSDAEGMSSRRADTITVACAFGNSLTLPLLFLSALLPPAEAERAAGYLALYMVG